MLQRIPADAATQADELKQLSRQGVGSFVGSASICCIFGVIEIVLLPPEDGNDVVASIPWRKRRRVACASSPGRADGTIKLGQMQRAYKLTRNTEYVEQLLKFAWSYEGTMPAAIGAKGFVRVAAWAGKVDVGFTSSCPVWQRQPGYSHALLRRKLALAALASVPFEERLIDWHDVSLAPLRDLSPDSSQSLESFPLEWSAGEVSSFCFGRSDWALLVPVSCCLFSDVARHSSSGERSCVEW